MQVMVIIKADAESEAGMPLDQDVLQEMHDFNNELSKAGVMISGEGLYPSSMGVRVKHSNGNLTVTDGPFAETKELIAGFWLWRVSSIDEAVEWVKRLPNPRGVDWEVEIRPVGGCTGATPDSLDEIVPQASVARLHPDGHFD